LSYLRPTAYPGAHTAIIDAQLWDEVQAILTANRNGEAGGGANEPSLLAGLIVDADGERMTPTHANSRGKRYRYYVSRRLIAGTAPAENGGWRVPASSSSVPAGSETASSRTPASASATSPAKKGWSDPMPRG